ncbi:unnamed protein product [Sphagnum balticum]
MGKGGFQHLVDTGIVKAKQKVGSSREKLYTLYNKPTLVTYDPNILNFMPELQEDINWDIRLAVRLATTGSLKPQVGNYEWVPDLARAFMWAYQDADKTVLNPVAVDLETLGLDEFDPKGRILTVQISWKVGHSIVYRCSPGPLDPAVKEQLEYLFSCPWINTIGANLKYDMRWLWTHWGLEIHNHKFDTQLVGGLLNENRHNSLKKHIKEYAPELGNYEGPFEDKWDKARMDIALDKDPEGFLQYAGGDTDGCLRIYTPMKNELIKDEKLAKFYTRLLHPASLAFRKLESRGIKIDKQRYLELKEEAEKERDMVSAECFAMMPNKIKYKYADNLKLTRDVIVQEFLFGPYGLNLKPKMATPKGMGKDKDGKDVIVVPSTAWNHLKGFIDHPQAGPFVKQLKKYNATCKTLDTYIVGFMSHLRSDGFFHPSYVLANGGMAGDEDEEGGTDTGRSSCKDPAWQCQTGGTLVLTQTGKRRMVDIVQEFGKGVTVKVLSHTGQWRLVTGVYVNGVRPVYEVKTKSGLSTTCTGNHPLLTSQGFARCDDRPKSVYTVRNWYGEDAGFNRKEIWKTVCGGDGTRQSQAKMSVFMRVWEGENSPGTAASRWTDKFLRLFERAEILKTWACKTRENFQNFLCVATHDGTLLSSQGQALQGLWRQGGISLSALGCVRQFFKRHGGGSRRSIIRPNQCKWELRTGELSLGYCFRASEQHTESYTRDLSRADSHYIRVGENYGGRRSAERSNKKGMVIGEGIHDARKAQEAGFVLDDIVSISYVGELETYDLTVEEDHSFVADGLVVHNTLPKKTAWSKRLRSVVICPPGYVLVKLDFSQGELRLMADASNCKTMIEAYHKGLDLHAITASEMLSLTFEQFMALPKDQIDAARDKAKPINFGLIFKISPEGLMAYADYSYNVKMTIQEATVYHTKFFEKYPEVRKHHELQIKIAKKFGFVRSPLGRVRHLPMINSFDGQLRGKAERNCINSPIQGTLFDMMMLLMSEIDKQRPDIWMFGNTHDSLEMYLKEDTWEQDAKLIKGIAENLPLEQFEWKPKVPFTVDFEFSKTTLADLKKVKIAA